MRVKANQWRRRASIDRTVADDLSSRVIGRPHAANRFPNRSTRSSPSKFFSAEFSGPETPNNIPLISSRSEKKSPPRFRAYLAPLIDSPSPLDLRLLEGLYVTRSNRVNPLPLGTFSPSAGYDRR